jgi:hypothetical protein
MSVHLDGLVPGSNTSEGDRSGCLSHRKAVYTAQKHADMAAAQLHCDRLNWMAMKAATETICYIPAHRSSAFSRVKERIICETKLLI